MTAVLRRLPRIEHQVGTDGTITIALWGDTGAALSVSGVTAEWKVYAGVPGRRRQPFSGSVLVTKTSAASEITLSTGSAAITILDTDFANRAGEYFHVIKITDGSGLIRHRGEGRLVLRGAI